MYLKLLQKYTLPIAALLVVVFGFMIWRIVVNNGTGTINLTVVPSDSQIIIDNKIKARSGAIRLKPGSHTFTITRNSFRSNTFSVVITAGQAQSRQVLLSATNSTAGQSWAASNSDEARQGEGIAGADANNTGQNTTDSNPLIAKLPYTGSDFQIDFGQSVKHPHDPNYVGIYITPDSPVGKQHAIDWIKAQGFNPDAYEIIYNQTYDS